jgi:hypothetical protein
MEMKLSAAGASPDARRQAHDGACGRGAVPFSITTWSTSHGACRAATSCATAWQGAVVKQCGIAIHHDDLVYRPQAGCRRADGEWFREGISVRVAFARSSVPQSARRPARQRVLHRRFSRIRLPGAAGYSFQLWTVMNAVLWHASWIEGDRGLSVTRAGYLYIHHSLHRPECRCAAARRSAERHKSISRCRRSSKRLTFAAEMARAGCTGAVLEMNEAARVASTSSWSAALLRAGLPSVLLLAARAGRRGDRSRNASALLAAVGAREGVPAVISSGTDDRAYAHRRESRSRSSFNRRSRCRLRRRRR